MTRAMAAFLGLVVLASTLVRAQATPLFTMDMANDPSYDFTGGHPMDGSSGQSQNRTVYYNYTHRATDGPGSTPAAEISMIEVTPPVAGGASPCNGQGSCEGYVGWGMSNPWTEQSQGAALYVRIYFKFSAYTDPRRADNGDWGGKMILVGDGCAPDTDRFIWNFQGVAGTNQPSWNIDKNINGIGIENDLPTDGQWHAYQVKVQSSSTDVATDGRISYYEDNDTEGSPTAQSGTFAWDNDCFDNNLKYGAYTDWLTDGVATYQIGALVVDDEFDSSWFANMGEGGEPPVAPALFRMRLRSAQMIFGVMPWSSPRTGP